MLNFGFTENKITPQMKANTLTFIEYCESVEKEANEKSVNTSYEIGSEVFVICVGGGYSFVDKWLGMTNETVHFESSGVFLKSDLMQIHLHRKATMNLVL